MAAPLVVSREDLGILLVIVTMPVRELSLGEFSGGNLRIGDLALLGVFCLWLVSGCMGRTVVCVRNRLDLSVAAFIVFHALSLTWASNIDAGWVRALKVMRNGVLYFLLARYLDGDFEQKYRRVAMWLVVTGLVASLAFVYSISQYGGLTALMVMLSAASLPSNDPLLGVVRTDQGAGLFLKGTASWLPLCMFIGVSSLQREKRRPSTVIQWSIISVMGVLTTLSMTRAAWVSLTVGGLTVIALSLSGRILKRMTRIVILALIVVTVGWYFNAGALVSSRFAVEVLETDPAVEDRLEYFATAVQRFREEPFVGAGVGSIDPRELFVVHNVYLQVLGELGVMGGVLLARMLWLWVLFGVRARRVATKSREETRRQVAIGMLGATVFFLTYFLVGHDLGSGEPWIVMAIVSALYSSRRKGASTRHKSGSEARWVWAVRA